MKPYKSRRKPFLAKRLERRGKRKFTLTIILGIFLAYALLVWILPALIGGLSVLNRFKSTPAKTESPISENSTLAPPVLNIPYEATSTAIISIKGYSIPNATVEIYLDDDLKSSVKVSDNGSFITENIDLSLGTNNISGKTVDEKGNKSFASKPIRIIYDNEKPKLELKEPSDNQIVKGDKKVHVSGSVDPDKDITVTVNELRLIVSPDGSFSQIIDINEGENNLIVTATNPAGSATSVTRKVTYQPG